MKSSRRKLIELVIIATGATILAVLACGFVNMVVFAVIHGGM